MWLVPLRVVPSEVVYGKGKSNNYSGVSTGIFFLSVFQSARPSSSMSSQAGGVAVDNAAEGRTSTQLSVVDEPNGQASHTASWTGGNPLEAMMARLRAQDASVLVVDASHFDLDVDRAACLAEAIAAHKNVERIILEDCSLNDVVCLAFLEKALPFCQRLNSISFARNPALGAGQQVSGKKGCGEEERGASAAPTQRVASGGDMLLTRSPETSSAGSVVDSIVDWLLVPPPHRRPGFNLVAMEKAGPSLEKQSSSSAPPHPAAAVQQFVTQHAATPLQAAYTLASVSLDGTATSIEDVHRLTFVLGLRRVPYDVRVAAYRCFLGDPSMNTLSFVDDPSDIHTYNEASLRVLVDSVKRNHSVRTLKLERNSCRGDHGAIVLAQLFLNGTGKNLSPAAVEMIPDAESADGVAGPATPIPSASLLSPPIVSVAAHLTILSLAGNGITSYGVIALCEALHEYYGSAEHARQCRVNGLAGLRSLNLSDNDIDDHGGLRLLDLVTQHRELQRVSLDGNRRLSHVVLDKVGRSAALNREPALLRTVIDALVNLDSEQQQTMTADAADNERVGLLAGATVIRIPGGHNQDGDPSRSYVSSLGAATLMRVLHGNHRVKEVHLPFNHIGPDGAKAIAEALRINGTVRVLNLIGNPIGTEGAKYLVDALQYNDAVVDLLLVAKTSAGTMPPPAGDAGDDTTVVVLPAVEEHLLHALRQKCLLNAEPILLKRLLMTQPGTAPAVMDLSPMGQQHNLAMLQATPHTPLGEEPPTSASTACYGGAQPITVSTVDLLDAILHRHGDAVCEISFNDHDLASEHHRRTSRQQVPVASPLVQAICRVVIEPNRPALRVLRLCGCCLAEADVVRLMHAVKLNYHIQHIHIAGNPTVPYAVTLALETAVALNRLAPRYIKDLASGLTRNLPSIISVALRDEGGDAEAVVDARNPPIGSGLAVARQQQRHQQRQGAAAVGGPVSLSRRVVDDEVVSLVVAALEENTSVTALDAADLGRLSSRSVALLCQWQRRAAARGMAALKHLDLSGNDIGPDAALDLAELLWPSDSGSSGANDDDGVSAQGGGGPTILPLRLQMVNLSRNHIGDAGAQHFIDAIKRSVLRENGGAAGKDGGAQAANEPATSISTASLNITDNGMSARMRVELDQWLSLAQQPRELVTTFAVAAVGQDRGSQSPRLEGDTARQSTSSVGAGALRGLAATWQMAPSKSGLLDLSLTRMRLTDTSCSVLHRLCVEAHKSATVQLEQARSRLRLLTSGDDTHPDGSSCFWCPATSVSLHGQADITNVGAMTVLRIIRRLVASSSTSSFHAIDLRGTSVTLALFPFLEALLVTYATSVKQVELGDLLINAASSSSSIGGEVSPPVIKSPAALQTITSMSALGVKVGSSGDGFFMQQRRAAALGGASAPVSSTPSRPFSDGQLSSPLLDSLSVAENSSAVQKSPGLVTLRGRGPPTNVTASASSNKYSPISNDDDQAATADTLTSHRIVPLVVVSPVVAQLSSRLALLLAINAVPSASHRQLLVSASVSRDETPQETLHSGETDGSAPPMAPRFVVDWSGMFLDDGILALLCARMQLRSLRFVLTQSADAQREWTTSRLAATAPRENSNSVLNGDRHSVAPLALRRSLTAAVTSLEPLANEWERLDSAGTDDALAGPVDGGADESKTLRRDGGRKVGRKAFSASSRPPSAGGPVDRLWASCLADPFTPAKAADAAAMANSAEHITAINLSANPDVSVAGVVQLCSFVKACCPNLKTFLVDGTCQPSYATVNALRSLAEAVPSLTTVDVCDAPAPRFRPHPWAALKTVLDKNKVAAAAKAAECRRVAEALRLERLAQRDNDLLESAAHMVPPEDASPNHKSTHGERGGGRGLPAAVAFPDEQSILTEALAARPPRKPYYRGMYLLTEEKLL